MPASSSPMLFSTPFYDEEDYYSAVDSYPYTIMDAIFAAGRGDIDYLKDALKDIKDPDERVCEAAATNGHLEVLIYARSRGCPWDEATCERAAFGGHLEVLQYAHENGCPWDIGTSEAASLSKNEGVIEYVRDHKCPTTVV